MGIGAGVGAFIDAVALAGALYGGYKVGQAINDQLSTAEGDDSQEQLEGIEKTQAKNRKLGRPNRIESIEGSKKRAESEWKRIRNLKDAQDLEN